LFIGKTFIKYGDQKCLQVITLTIDFIPLVTGDSLAASKQAR
jgi:hypothetical protein